MDLSLVKSIQEKVKELEFKEQMKISFPVYHKITGKYTINIFSIDMYVYEYDRIILVMPKKDFMEIKTQEDLCGKLKKI